MATDIAFALGVLALLGPRVPAVLKVFLAALAIVDDIGAVVVIALFYTAAISWTALGLGACIIGLLLLLNRAGVRHPGPYALLGVLLWLAFLSSGVHATVAGVLLAMTIPARTRIDERQFLAWAEDSIEEFRRGSDRDASLLTNNTQLEAIHALEEACEDAQSPLMRLEDKLHGIVAFGIMPLFALANAGVALGGNAGGGMTSPVAAGIVLGLVVGKPLGITLAAWLAVRLGLAVLPAEASWRALHGVSWLGGIGFTMSLFIAGLAFGTSPLLDAAKLGILSASIIAGIGGWLLLRRPPAPAPAPRRTAGAAAALPS
jgi:NhaA family Na+:H+ antiporter